MATTALRIPSADEGEEEGLNLAGVEFFMGDIDYFLARETAQNVIDSPATDGETVRLEFQLERMQTANLPCIESIRDAVGRCRDYWKLDRKSAKFFDDAKSLLKKDSVNVLRISDFGTTGLTGTDKDRQGRWFGLVRSAGVSNKDEEAGGSFGIGKYAPVAASAIRTVLYSTRTSQPGAPFEGAFQGVLRLASHENAQKQVTRQTGYIGDCLPGISGCAAIRQEQAIPPAFRRTQKGTDIFVLAYRNGDGWDRRLLRSVLENFWPAIHRKIVTFRVSARDVHYGNLPALLDEFSADDGFRAHLYYKALQNGQAHTTVIPDIGKVTLYLWAGAEDLPKSVAMTRKTGMVIEFKAFRSRRPFCGYLVCDDPGGNTLLRSLEPPRHNQWDPKRGSPREQKALGKLYDWVREQVKALNPISESGALDIPDLARYLPDNDPAEENGPSNEGSQSQEDVDFAPHVPQGNIPLEPAPETPPGRLEPVNDGDGQPDDNGGPGDGDDIRTNTGGSGGDHDPNPFGGGGGTGGEIPRTKPTKKPGLALRSFIRKDGKYQLVLRCSDANASGFRLFSVGEDGRTDSPQITTAHDADDGTALAVSGSRITVPIPAGGVRRVIVGFKRNLKVALSAEATCES